MNNLKEMKKEKQTIPLNNSIDKPKYLLTNLTKEAKVLKTTRRQRRLKNYKTLLK